MADSISRSDTIPSTPDKILAQDEIVVIADNDAASRTQIRSFLESSHFKVAEAENAEALRNLFYTARVALILLDRFLATGDVTALLGDIINTHPDVAIIILAEKTEQQTVLDCLRHGADYYLTKPFQPDEGLVIIQKTLEKRQLRRENLGYRQESEKAQFRIQLLHQLSLKMNSLYLSTVELDEILLAVLVGITAAEGLRFNRAFLAIFDEQGRILYGKQAIGAECREEAGRIWAELRDQQLDFLEIIQNIKKSCFNGDTKITQLIQKLQVPITDTGHILIKSALERRSIPVENGRAEVPVSRELIELLGEDTFVVVPLYSPRKSLGVIIADNFVTREPITRDHIRSLEIFANQASLAMEHSRLYMEMEDKIDDLENVTHELEKNKDLLVESESYSALGQMSAQLVHVLRNPITSIGGAARILAKKITDEKCLEFVNMIVNETTRLESTLKDLFDFVRQMKVEKKCEPLYPLIKKTLLLLQPTLVKHAITVDIDIADPEPILEMDEQLIRKMMIHLTRNAIDAMPAGGNLTISVHKENGWIVISFVDTGVGIAEAIQKRATDPFFTTKTYGTGLGLTLVEKIVAIHGGSFLLQKKPDGGMEARVSLPEKIVCSFGI